MFFSTECITYQATPITVKQEIATIIHIHQFDASDIVVISNLMILEEDLEGSWTLVATTFSSCLPYSACFLIEIWPLFLSILIQLIFSMLVSWPSTYKLKWALLLDPSFTLISNKS